MNAVKKSGRTACIIFAAISLTAFIGLNKTPVKKDIVKTEGKGFAVLELFTSEGCSSCPPADNLMAKLQQEDQGKSVYVLAYHVDYWDRQGWKDIFSSADFSNRQKQYGQWLNVSPIYTPQVIINGKTQFVGSDESAIRNAISGQLKANPEATLEIHVQQNNGKLSVQYKTNKAAKGSHILIAIIQKAAQSKVARGENAGRTLSHIQIVRKLQTEPVGINGSGSVSVELPKDFNVQNWEVIGLIQDQNNGQILAVDQADLGNAAKAKN